MIIRLLFILRRRWPILIVLPLLAAGMGYLFTPRGDAKLSSSYEAEALVTVEQASVTTVQAQQAILQAQQGEIAERAARTLGGGITTDDVRSRISARFDEDSYVIEFAGSGDRPADAEAVAEAFAKSFVELGNAGVTDAQEAEVSTAEAERDAAKAELADFLQVNGPALSDPSPPLVLVNELEVLETTVASTEAALEELRTNQQTNDIYSFVNVTAGARPLSAKLQLPASLGLRMSLGLIFGLVGAGALVALVERLNPRIDDPEQASELVGAPVLAMVPVMGRRRRGDIERSDPQRFRGPFAESFRSMRAHLDFRASAEGAELPPRIMITSATPSEGKSTTTAFLALAFAEADRPPVVVGADLRRPSVHKFFDMERVPGLSSRAASGGTSIPLAEIVRIDPLTGVSVIPSGPAVDRVTGLLGDLTAVTLAGQQSDRVVLVDTAPVMVANDATDFLIAVDWVVVVVRVGRSTQRAVRQMMQTLRLNEANVVGVVMVGSLESSDAKRYYNSYYADEAVDKRERARAAPLAPSDGTPVPVTGSVDAEA